MHCLQHIGPDLCCKRNAGQSAVKTPVTMTTTVKNKNKKSPKMSDLGFDLCKDFNK